MLRVAGGISTGDARSETLHATEARKLQWAIVGRVDGRRKLRVRF